MNSKYFAYHVDYSGATRASYELHATSDDAAKAEAKHLLKFHPSIEIWQGAHRVARLARDEDLNVPNRIEPSGQ
jgi:hypothetical protein